MVTMVVVWDKDAFNNDIITACTILHDLFATFNPIWPLRTEKALSLCGFILFRLSGGQALR